MIKGHTFLSLRGAYESPIIRIILPLFTDPISQSCIYYPPYGDFVLSHTGIHDYIHLIHPEDDIQVAEGEHRGLADQRAVAATCKSGQKARAQQHHATPPAMWICLVWEGASYLSPPLAIQSLRAVHSANCGRVHPDLGPSTFRTCPDCSTCCPCRYSRPHCGISLYRHLSCTQCAHALP